MRVQLTLEIDGTDEEIESVLDELEDAAEEQGYALLTGIDRAKAWAALLKVETLPTTGRPPGGGTA